MISDGEKSFLRYLDSLYIEGSEARSKASHNWANAVEIIKGNVWPKRRPKYKVSAVMNFLSQVVDRKAALLTDSRPTISVTSRKRQDDPICEVLQKTIEGILDEKNFEQKLTEFVMLEEYFGFALFNTCYDRTLDYGRGDIDLVVIDPRCFIFDPYVTRSWNLKHGEYQCLEVLKPTELLRDLNPKRADDIKADLSQATVKEDSLIHRLRTLFKFDNSPAEKTSAIDRSVVRDWWIRDRKTRIDGSQTADNPRGQLLFPNWRHIIVAGGCIIEDGANPYIDGDSPFDGMEWNFNVDSPYGLNEIDQLESPQLMFNKILASVIENAILMGNGIWVGDSDALSKEDWAKLTNEPGSHVKKRPGKDLHREAPPALPNYIMAALTMILQGMEKLSGITEAVEGRRPGQAASGVAIESLQIAAQTTIRLKARQLENLIQRVGQKLIPRIFSYYTTDRVLNFVGRPDRAATYLFERERIRRKIAIEGEQCFRDYQFKVVPSSSLATTKWQKAMMATQMYQMGLLDEQAALEAIEWPNFEEVLKRMNQSKKEQALIAALGAGGNGKGGFGRKSAPAKIPSNLLGGPNRQTALQEPQSQ